MNKVLGLPKKPERKGPGKGGSHANVVQSSKPTHNPTKFFCFVFVFNTKMGSETVS